MSFEQQYKLRTELLMKYNFSDKELDEKIQAKIDEAGGFINEIAAMVLINKDMGGSAKLDALGPEQKARNKLLKEGEKFGITAEILDKMLSELKTQSVYIKQNDMLAYELIGKKMGITISDDVGVLQRSVETQTVAQALEAPFGETFAVNGYVTGQSVQRKKGGEWTKLYRTHIIDHTGKSLTLKTAKRDNPDFSHLFLHWGRWYAFYGVNRAEGSERETPLPDGSTHWDDTWWWVGEAEPIDPIGVIPSHSLSSMTQGYDIYVLEGIVSNFTPASDWTLYNHYTDNFEKSQAVNQPEAKEIGDSPGFNKADWGRRYRFSLSTESGRIQCSTRGFDIMVRQKTLRVGERLEPLSTLENTKIKIYGQLTENPNTHELLFLVQGLITSSGDGVVSQVQDILSKYISLVGTPSNEPKNEVVEAEPLPTESEFEPSWEHILAWYVDYIKREPSPIPYQQFKRDLETAFQYHYQHDETVMDIINDLIEEGMVKKFMGALVYPNV